jgi:hypothetical protein
MAQPPLSDIELTFRGSWGTWLNLLTLMRGCDRLMLLGLSQVAFSSAQLARRLFLGETG